MTSAMKRTYVDTNIISVVVRQDKSAELAALNRLFDANDSGLVVLVTSAVAKRELEQSPPDKRVGDEELYARLHQLPEIEPQPLMHLRPITSAPGPKGPLPIRVPEFGFLDDLLRDRADAEHIFQANANSIDYFVTMDVRTILMRRVEIEARLPIRLRRPSELVTELAL